MNYNTSFHWKAALLLTALAGISPLPAYSQNWGLTIQDLGVGTPLNQANGVTGGTATLYGTVYNYTGTSISDDGAGTASPAPPTQLDFAGFGWTLLPGQNDLESRFSGIGFGTVQVAGSPDGFTAADSGYVALGTFDLTGLAPGFYEQDFSAAAFPTDFNSSVPFDTLTGTIRLNVFPTVVPEASTVFLVITTGGIFGLSIRRRIRFSRK